MATIESLLETIKKNYPEADLTPIQEAYNFAFKAHETQSRASGETYINHPLAAAQYLAEMKLDKPIIIAALLHDVPEDTGVSLETIEENFGSDVAGMVSGVTKLGHIKYRGVERYIENLRKMFVAVAQDVRIMIIKFADRLHNLQTIDALPEKKRQRIALESLEIFAPIAGRLGMGEIKGQLEDLSFKYTDPENYAWINKILTENFEQSKTHLEEVRLETEAELKKSGIKIISLKGRLKHIYSLYKKLLRYNKDIKNVRDIVALRVVVETIADCYATLGIVHKLWHPVPNRIKDYIAQLKPNGYQSLHTTVLCHDNQVIEFQIRTEAMNEEAEYGVAAYWHYKEQNKGTPKQIAWIKELEEIQKNAMANLSDIENLKIDFFQNRIFVWTPKGDIIDLPEHATPVDFAYAIHTDIGNKCVACRVNSLLSKLDSSLRNGDMVEIIVDKKRKGPNPEWADFVKTRSAREHIRLYAKSSISVWLKDRLPFTNKGKEKSHQ